MHVCFDFGFKTVTSVIFCTACNRNLTENGLIVSPDNELGSYPNNTFCEYYISNPDDEGCLSLSFLEFQLEEVDENGRCKDFITVSCFVC